MYKIFFILVSMSVASFAQDSTLMTKFYAGKVGPEEFIFSAEVVLPDTLVDHRTNKILVSLKSKNGTADLWLDKTNSENPYWYGRLAAAAAAHLRADVVYRTRIKPQSDVSQEIVEIKIK